MRWVPKNDDIRLDSLIKKLERVMGNVVIKEKNASTSICLFSGVRLEMIFEPL